MTAVELAPQLLRLGNRSRQGREEGGDAAKYRKDDHDLVPLCLGWLVSFVARNMMDSEVLRQRPACMYVMRAARASLIEP